MNFSKLLIFIAFLSAFRLSNAFAANPNFCETTLVNTPSILGLTQRVAKAVVWPPYYMHVKPLTEQRLLTGLQIEGKFRSSSEHLIIQALITKQGLDVYVVGIENVPARVLKTELSFAKLPENSKGLVESIVKKVKETRWTIQNEHLADSDGYLPAITTSKSMLSFAHHIGLDPRNEFSPINYLENGGLKVWIKPSVKHLGQEMRGFPGSFASTPNAISDLKLGENRMVRIVALGDHLGYSAGNGGDYAKLRMLAPDGALRELSNFDVIPIFPEMIEREIDPVTMKRIEYSSGELVRLSRSGEVVTIVRREHDIGEQVGGGYASEYVVRNDSGAESLLSGRDLVPSRYWLK